MDGREVVDLERSATNIKSLLEEMLSAWKHILRTGAFAHLEPCYVRALELFCAQARETLCCAEKNLPAVLEACRRDLTPAQSFRSSLDWWACALKRAETLLPRVLVMAAAAAAAAAAAQSGEDTEDVRVRAVRAYLKQAVEELYPSTWVERAVCEVFFAARLSLLRLAGSSRRERACGGGGGSLLVQRLEAPGTNLFYLFDASSGLPACGHLHCDASLLVASLRCPRDHLDE